MLDRRTKSLFWPGAAPDVVTVLTVYVVLLLAIPSDLRVGPLGGAGAPAGLFALALGLWWCWFHVQKDESAMRVSGGPVRRAQFLMFGAFLASYVAAMLRPLSTVEASQANIGLLRLAMAAAILLIACDGINDGDRLVVLIRRLVWGATLFAALGLMQFVTGLSLVDSVTIPGLVSTQEYSNVAERGLFTRSAATAMSPLEYAVALSVALPLALGLALEDRARPFVVRWLPVVIVAGALSVSTSRSALLGLVVGVLFLLPGLSRGLRAVVVTLGTVFLAGVLLVVPGMFGTIVYLFGNVENDPSALSRTGSYALVDRFFFEAPIFGRGFGTFLPEYRILDNQYLQFAIEVGAVGLAAFAGLMLTAVVCVLRARRRVRDPLLAVLGQALAASVAAGAMLSYFFDSFSFPIAVGMLFLVLGLCGAYWRLCGQDSRTRTQYRASRTPIAVAEGEHRATPPDSGSGLSSVRAERDRSASA